MTAPQASDPAFALPDRRAARALFDRASAHFDEASFVHDHARDILLERLQFLRVTPARVLDLGCGTGRGLAALRARFPTAGLVAADSSAEMCARAFAAAAASEAVVVAADAAELPFADASFELVVANLVMAWCQPEQLFSEIARVLAPSGLVLFSSLGPDTLEQVRRAWSRSDRGIHVHGFFDMHDLADAAARSGLREPIVDCDHLTLSYPDSAKLHADLRAAGATNVAGGRRRSLTGRQRFEAYGQALVAALSDPDGRLQITCELIFGQAFGRPSRGGSDGLSFAVPVESIGRRSLS
jgi:malonyl-CoA O-methyltransferase